MNTKRTFTLVELLIVVIIIWILVVLIFRIYMQIANISIRVENEKVLNNELLSMSQTIQNIPDEYYIDFSKYDSTLSSKYWYTKILYLTWTWWPISIYATWDCIDNISSISEKFCRLQMNKNWQVIDLTDKNKIYFTKYYFKLIPYKDASTYNIPFAEIYHHGYGVHLESYIKRYNVKTWSFSVKLNYTNFFNLRKY